MAVEGLGWGEVPGMVLAFLVGMGVLCGFYWAWRVAGRASGAGDNAAGQPAVPQLERLEYYESELVHMKIRMDALEMEGEEGEAQAGKGGSGDGQKAAEKADQIGELKRMLEGVIRDGVKGRQDEKGEAPPAPRPRAIPERPAPAPAPGLEPPGAGPMDPPDYVLHLVTNKAMTSRDIQVILKKSREHTSRLMKRLFDDGYVERDTGVRPYTYSISEKGRARLAESG